MTKVYFVRHAQPDYTNHDDMLRELTPKGLKDRELVTAFLDDKNIDVVLSSPFKRAIDTVSDFADKHNLKIEIIEDFRERKIGTSWIDDFNAYAKRQWNDFDYKFEDGESLREVQNRNIKTLYKVLDKYPNKNVVIGSHGTALSTLIHYFDPSFGYDDFEMIRNIMPWIVEFDFDEQINCTDIYKYDVLNQQWS